MPGRATLPAAQTSPSETPTQTHRQAHETNDTTVGTVERLDETDCTSVGTVEPLDETNDTSVEASKQPHETRTASVGEKYTKSCHFSATEVPAVSIRSEIVPTELPQV